MSIWLIVPMVGLYSLMAIRAFRSGSAVDYVLGAAQALGLIALLTPFSLFALYFLLMTSAAYLVSQVLTGARPISHLLPVSGAAVVLLALLTVTS